MNIINSVNIITYSLYKKYNFLEYLLKYVIIKTDTYHSILEIKVSDFDNKGVGIMRYTISGKNIDVTEGLKNAIYEKMDKLEKYFTPDTEIIVTLSVEKERKKIEVTIPVKGNIIRSEQVSSDMYVSIDLVEEVIERQLKKYKNKLISKKQNATSFKQEFIDNEYDEDEEVKIVRTKKFSEKPMYPEDACVQMELLGHNFFVFTNAETDDINVVYKRKDNTYGIIEPE